LLLDGQFMAQLIEIYKYMDPNRIIDITSDNKNDALKELAKVIGTSDIITDEELFLKKIYDREKLMSTGIGYSIAVPHIRDASIKDFVIALGRKAEGLDYESIDNKPVKLILHFSFSRNISSCCADILKWRKTPQITADRWIYRCGSSSRTKCFQFYILRTDKIS